MSESRDKLMRRAMGMGTKIPRAPQDLSEEQRLFLRKLYKEYNTFNQPTREAAGLWMKRVSKDRTENQGECSNGN